MNRIGSSFPNEGPCEEPDIEHSLADDQEDGDKEGSEYAAPELVARTPCYPILGARSGLLLDPENTRIGRHRVVEEVPSGQEGTRVQGGWTGDYKKFALCRSHLVTKQLATSAHDDVTQTPALQVFRLMIATRASGLLGMNACFAIYDISVAFPHPGWTR